MRFQNFVSALCAAILSCSGVSAAEMKMAVTTSFENSGLADILLPQIKTDLDLDVQLIVVGTGQAIKLGSSGDVDAILVHSRKAEDAFVAEGFAPHRRQIMYNDFVIVGPSTDPAGIVKAADAKDALTKIAGAGSLFASRGDDSGTHQTELSLWQMAGIDPAKDGAAWYRATGSGMGATLNTASGLNAYVLSDRASWLKFGNKGELKLLFAGDPVMFNQYAYMPVSKAKHPHVKADSAATLENWLVSKKAQKMIGDYTINGEKLFTPNAVTQ